MDNRTNVIAMMVLGAGIVALGTTIVTGEFFHGERPEKMGYVVEGVEAEGSGGVAAVAIPIGTLMAKADPAKGQEVFQKCAACHNANQGGANGIGPNLWAVVGRPRASLGGFAYSDALKGKPGTWDFAALNEWLTSPRAYAPGTKMTFAGLSKPEDRGNVLAYLNKQGSNLPMPAAPTPEASPATPGGQTKPAASASPPGGPQPGGSPKGTSTPATKPNI